MILRSFQITGFRDFYNISGEFDARINYIIGHNGTGKTTLVKILVAATRLNTLELLSAAFRSLEVTLGDRQGGTVLRKLIFYRDSETQTELGSRAFRLTVHLPDGRRLETTSDALRFARGSPPYNAARMRSPERRGLPATLDPLDRRAANAALLDAAMEIRALQKAVIVNWLPIERTIRQKAAPSTEDATVEWNNPVNQKLEDVQRQLVLYSYDLDKRKAAAFEQFRNRALLALFNVEIGSKRGAKTISKTAIAKVEAELHDAIPKLGLGKELERQFRDGSSALFDALRNHKNGRPVEALRQALARLQDVLAVWGQTQEIVQHLYAQRDHFLRSLKDAFSLSDLEPQQSRKFAKKPLLAENNDIEFQQEFGEEEVALKLNDLSSGEKQFFIMLAEALLERNQDTIFVIDEPEISLHITWQARLVEDLRLLNPNAQLIVATHSPDIVQDQRQNIIRMEDAVVAP